MSSFSYDSFLNLTLINDLLTHGLLNDAISTSDNTGLNYWIIATNELEQM
jgi:hypothetical protein